MSLKNYPGLQRQHSGIHIRLVQFESKVGELCDSIDCLQSPRLLRPYLGQLAAGMKMPEERTDFHRAANGAVYQNDQLIIRLTGETPFAVLQDFCRQRDWTLSDNGTSPLETSSGWVRVEFPSPTTADQAVIALNSADFEVEVRRNYILETNRIPNDTHWTDGTAWALKPVGAPEAWDITTGSRDIVVAVLDTGIDLSHPDLAANIWTNLREIPNNGLDDDGNGFVDDANGFDFVQNDTSPVDGSYSGHGTAVASIVGAIGDNGRGIPGVAWDVQLMPVRVLGDDGRGTPL